MFEGILAKLAGKTEVTKKDVEGAIKETEKERVLSPEEVKKSTQALREEIEKGLPPTENQEIIDKAIGLDRKEELEVVKKAA